ncbi:hypothetical protein BRPE64_ACDS28990 [Caballeronia insecticola]|uniref:Uncharacterized protein n=2 Tax=Caballeronia insecticola TaxID=758793 RepID=R4WJK4_9BURK|nr:hypothetical protein BRPE64_ACDS28990 [Caballeronia insecticola]
MLNRERWERKQRTQQQDQSLLTLEEQLSEANRVLNEVSHHLVMAARAIAAQKHKR